jgi:hypothetical protein
MHTMYCDHTFTLCSVIAKWLGLWIGKGVIQLLHLFFFEEKYAGVPPFSLSKKEHTRVQKGYLQLTGHKKTEKMKETQRTEDTNTGQQGD